MGTSLAGQCGASPPASVSVSVPVPTSNTVSYTINGQTHTASRQSGGGIVDANMGNSACSATLTQSTVNAGAATSGPSMAMVAMLLLVAGAAAVRN